LSLVLRNQVDKQDVVTQGITKKQLLGEPSAPPRKPVVGKSRPVASATVVKQATNCVEVFQNGFMVLKCF
jgi:Flp pilus assembly protein CpaB